MNQFPTAKITLRLLSILVLSSTTLPAQVTASTTMNVIPHQGDGIDIEFKSGTAAALLPPSWFGSPAAPGLALSRYKLYQVQNLNTANPTKLEVTTDYIDSSRPVSVLFDDFVAIPMKQPLHSDLSYLLEAVDDQRNSLDVLISASPSIAASDQQHVRDELFVNANVPLTTQYATGSVSVTYNSGVGQTSIPVSAVNAQSSQGLELKLTKLLPAGTANPLQVSIKGIKDIRGTSITVTGTVASAPAAPTDTTKDFLSIVLSAIAATHTAPTFYATGTFAPIHTAADAVVLSKRGFRRIELSRNAGARDTFGNLHFDPSVVFDAGSTNANSKNSVIVPSEFTYPVLLGLPKTKPGEIALIRKEPSKITVMNLMGGLRAEVDTANLGLNLMGEGRVELYFNRLFQTATRHQAKVSTLNPAIRSTLNLPTNGFSITPYAQYDGGNHVTSESVPNASSSLPSVSIFTFPISRFYFGSQATVQWARQTVSSDGSWAELFLPEMAAFTQNKTTFTRSISGLQPHAKGTYAIAIDQEKHFSGTIAWENGRSAPSFAYLNKVTVGVQVVY